MIINFFIDQIEPLNIEARYHSQEERLFKSFTNEKCIQLIHDNKEIQEWIKMRL